MFMHERDLVMDFDDMDTLEWSPTDELADDDGEEDVAGPEETTWEWDGETWRRVA
jgi:hypothetical protein